MFSPDGRRLATATQDGLTHTIQIHDAADGRVLARRVVDSEPVLLDLRGGQLAYILTLANANGAVTLVRSDDLSEVRQLSTDPVWGGFPQALRIVSDGLVTVDEAGVATRWDFSRSWEAAPPDA